MEAESLGPLLVKLKTAVKLYTVRGDFHLGKAAWCLILAARDTYDAGSNGGWLSNVLHQGKKDEIMPCPHSVRFLSNATAR